MAVQTPEDMHPTFEAAFNARDLEALLALYEAGAALMPEPGVVVTGQAAMREALATLLALPGALTMTTKALIATDDLVLLHAAWTLDGAGPGDTPVALAGYSSEVVRRQPDGTWRYILDNPYGADAS